MKYEFNKSTKSIRLVSWTVAALLLTATIFLGYQNRQYFGGIENGFGARADGQIDQSLSDKTVGTMASNGDLNTSEFNQSAQRVDTNCGGLLQEAELATLNGLFKAGEDTDASGGQYVHVPQGSGDRFDGADLAHKVSFCVMIPEDGTYRVKSYVYAQGASNNSMYIQLDDTSSDITVWNIPTNGSYDETYVTNAQTSQVIEYGLTAGPHIITFFLREDDTRLDKIEVELVGAMPLLSAAALAPKIKEPHVQGHIHTDAGDSWIPKQTAPQVAEVLITVVDANSNGQTFSKTTTTDSEGNYSLSGMAAGIYTINIAVPDGHRSIGPAELTVFTNEDQIGFASFDLMVLDQDPMIDTQDDLGNPDIYIPIVQQ